jgi:hypothetical protein
LRRGLGMCSAAMVSSCRAASFALMMNQIA